MPKALGLRTAFAPAHGDGQYVARLDDLRHKHASGAYAIIDARTREVLYIGESHTGRLFDTLTRHFRSWAISPDQDAQGRRRGGTEYDRQDVLVALCITSDARANELQVDEIARLDPTDNLLLFPADDLPI